MSARGRRADAVVAGPTMRLNDALMCFFLGCLLLAIVYAGFFLG